jgi:hypothetical protein
VLCYRAHATKNSNSVLQSTKHSVLSAVQVLKHLAVSEGQVTPLIRQLGERTAGISRYREEHV